MIFSLVTGSDILGVDLVSTGILDRYARVEGQDRLVKTV